MRIVLKSAEKDFVLSHVFGILPLMLWMMWLSSFDPKARIPLWSKCNIFASMRPELQKFGIVMWYSWNWKLVSDTNKAKRYEISKTMFVCKVLVKCLQCIRLIREGSRRTPVMWWRWIKQQLKKKGSVQRVSVRLTRLGSPRLTPLLKLGASSESRRNIGSKTVRSIKAKERRLEYPAHVWMSYKL